MTDRDRILLYILIVLTVLSLVVNCVSVLFFFVITVLREPSFQTQLAATPHPWASPAPTITPSVSNLLSNGNLDKDDFGYVVNWAQSNVDLLRWHLVQDIAPADESRGTRWIERVDLRAEGRGYGLRSIDYQQCDFFCSVSAIQIVPAEEEQWYTLSAEARREQGSGGGIYLDFLDARKARIEANSKGGYSDRWTEQSLTARAPAGTAYIRVILYSSNKAQGIVYWDNVVLRVEGGD
jgi:hypothetical protein